MIKVIHYRDRCIGCYYCVEVAPQRWRMNEEDGKSDLIEGEFKKEFFQVLVFEDEYDSVKEAESLCPVNVIRVLKV